jgi:hypothetical protein
MLDAPDQQAMPEQKIKAVFSKKTALIKIRRFL